MPKKQKGTVVKKRGELRHTSPRATALHKRWLEAYEYRRAGHSYSAIAEQMGCAVSVAHHYVRRATDKLVPAETIMDVLRRELSCLDELQAGFYADAAKGDITATKMVLEIMQHRDRLMGFSRRNGSGAPLVNVAIGSDSKQPDACVAGIRVSFVGGLEGADADEEGEKLVKAVKAIGPVTDGHTH
ncbi:MAG: hypothetical protein WAK55_06465 [Xanthobacteraceae bacterium]